MVHERLAQYETKMLPYTVFQFKLWHLSDDLLCVCDDEEKRQLWKTIHANWKLKKLFYPWLIVWHCFRWFQIWYLSQNVSQTWNSLPFISSSAVGASKRSAQCASVTSETLSGGQGKKREKRRSRREENRSKKAFRNFQKFLRWKPSTIGWKPLIQMIIVVTVLSQIRCTTLVWTSWNYLMKSMLYVFKCKKLLV